MPATEHVLIMGLVATAIIGLKFFLSDEGLDDVKFNSKNEPLVTIYFVDNTVFDFDYEKGNMSMLQMAVFCSYALHELCLSEKQNTDATVLQLESYSKACKELSHQRANRKKPNLRSFITETAFKINIRHAQFNNMQLKVVKTETLAYTYKYVKCYFDQSFVQYLKYCDRSVYLYTTYGPTIQNLQFYRQIQHAIIRCMRRIPIDFHNGNINHNISLAFNKTIYLQKAEKWIRNKNRLDRDDLWKSVLFMDEVFFKNDSDKTYNITDLLDNKFLLINSTIFHYNFHGLQIKTTDVSVFCTVVNKLLANHKTQKYQYSNEMVVQIFKYIDQCRRFEQQCKAPNGNTGSDSSSILAQACYKTFNNLEIPLLRQTINHMYEPEIPNQLEEEPLSHLLTQCEYVRQAWKKNNYSASDRANLEFDLKNCFTVLPKKYFFELFNQLNKRGQQFVLPQDFKVANNSYSTKMEFWLTNIIKEINSNVVLNAEQSQLQNFNLTFTNSKSDQMTVELSNNTAEKHFYPEKQLFASSPINNITQSEHFPAQPGERTNNKHADNTSVYVLPTSITHVALNKAESDSVKQKIRFDTHTISKSSNVTVNDISTNKSDSKLNTFLFNEIFLPNRENQSSYAENVTVIYENSSITNHQDNSSDKRDLVLLGSGAIAGAGLWSALGIGLPGVSGPLSAISNINVVSKDEKMKDDVKDDNEAEQTTAAHATELTKPTTELTTTAETTSSETTAAQTTTTEITTAQTTTTAETTTETTTTAEATTETTTMETTTTETTEAQRNSLCYKEKYLEDFFLDNESDKLNDTDITVSRKKRHNKPACKVVISEFHSMPTDNTIGEFVELRKVCSSGARPSSNLKLDKYILLILEASDEPKITLIARLKTLSFRSNMLATIGSKTGPYIDMLFSNPDVQNAGDENNIIPDGIGYPNGILVLEKPRASAKVNMLNLPKLNGKYQKLHANAEIIRIIKQLAVDMVVYGSHLSQRRCNIYEEIHNDLAVTPDYCILVWNAAHPNLQDNSVNRCTTSMITFTPYVFKVGPPSPSAPNECLDSVPFFITHELVEMFANANIEANPIELPSSSACDSSQNVLAEIPQLTYQQAITANRKQIRGTRTQILSPDFMFGEKILKMTRLDELVKKFHAKVRTNQNTIFPWEDTSDFKSEWEYNILNYQSDLVDTNEILTDEYKTWLEYLPRTPPEDSRFRCRFCNKFFDNHNRHDRPSSTLKTELMSSNGMLITGNNARTKNMKNFRDHTQSEVHKDAIGYLIERTANIYNTELQQSSYFATDAQNKYWQPLTILFRLVYFEVRFNIPCHIHEQLYDFLVFHGVNIGKHYYSPKACHQVAMSISTNMHRILTTELMRTKNPFSIQVDTAGVGNHHILLVNFQTVENSESIVYLYKAIALGSDTTAQGHFDAFVAALNDDGPEFVEYFKLNIISMSSDGDSVFTGHTNSFYTRLNEFTGKQLIRTHCFSHKGQLVFRNAILEDTSELIQKVEQVLNDIYLFYAVYNYRRNAHLKEFVEDLGKKFLQPKRLFETRWVSSERKTVETFILMYEFIVKDLLSISVDMTFAKKTRDKAMLIANRIKGKKFILVVHFLLELNTYFSKFSVSSQHHGATIIGVYDSIKGLKTALERIQNREKSPVLNKFFSTCKCGTLKVGTCNIEHYENKHVVFQNIELHGTLYQAPSYNYIRQHFTESLLRQLDNYFPLGDLEIYEILNPKNLPLIRDPSAVTSEPSVLDYKVPEALQLFKMVGVDVNTEVLKRDWYKLLETLACNNLYEIMKRDSPERFWSVVLKMRKIEWTVNTKSLVTRVLSISTSTASVESFFSIANHISDNKRRSRLSAATFDAFIRIRVNSKLNWSKWNALYYSKEWLSAGGSRPDDESLRVNKKILENKEEDLKTGFRKSFLF